MNSARKSFVIATIMTMAQLGCSADSGVHVVITMDEAAWAHTRAFSHVMIRAESGDQLGLACLFPRHFDDEAVEISTELPHACADLESGTIDQELDFNSWGFDSATGRSVNFVFPAEGPVSITATAGLGGRLGLYTAEAEIQADSNYPTATLVLEANSPPVFGMNQCPLQLSQIAGSRFKCNGKGTSSCVFGAATGSVTGAVTPNEESCRIDNQPGQANCSEENMENYVAVADLFYMPAMVDPPVVTSTVRARFARCVDGTAGMLDCPLTSDCSMRPTSIAAISNFFEVVEQGQPIDGSNRLISCLPPSVIPMEFRFNFVTKAGVNVAALMQQPAEEDDACFLDLYEIEFDVDI